MSRSRFLPDNFTLALIGTVAPASFLPATGALVDRGSILLVVYTAFSAAVVEGLWSHIPVSALGGLLVVCAVLARRYSVRAAG